MKATHQGTCQVCFRVQKLAWSGHNLKYKLVLHGYQRPGIGSIVGECWGYGWEPFEKSCEQTKTWRERMQRLFAAFVEEKARLVAKPEVLLFPPKHERSELARFADIRIERGAESRLMLVGNYQIRIPSYESQLYAVINHVDYEMQSVEREIRFLTEKIASWKLSDVEPVPPEKPKVVWPLTCTVIEVGESVALRCNSSAGRYGHRRRRFPLYIGHTSSGVSVYRRFKSPAEIPQ